MIIRTTYDERGTVRSVSAKHYLAISMYIIRYLGCIVLLFEMFSCGPDDECTPPSAKCENNVAYFCGLSFSDAHKSNNPYIWKIQDCNPSMYCIIGTERAFCSLTRVRDPKCPKSVDPSTGEPSTTAYAYCLGDYLIWCRDGYPVSRKSCKSCDLSGGTYPECQ
jgi:hypothetical protein